MVNVEGISGEQLKNARSNLGLLQVKDVATRRPSNLRYLARQGVAQIQKSLEPFGYYQAKVTSGIDVIDDKVFTVSYAVERGEQVRIRRVSIEINGDAKTHPAFTKILKTHRFEVGAALSQPAWEALKNDLTVASSEHGFLEAQFGQSVIDVYPSLLAADLVMRYDSGEQFYISDISIEQNQFHQAFIDRYIDISPGDVYETTEVNSIRQRLLKSNYFGGVTANSDVDEENRTVSVRYLANAAKRHHYLAGIGYSSNYGARIKLGYDRRWINRKGHSIHTYVDTSQRYGSAVASYRIPGPIPYREFTSIRIGIDRDEYNDLFSERDYIGVLNDHRSPSTSLRYSVRYQREQYKYGDDSLHWFENDYLLAEAQLTWYSVKDHVAPDNGFKLQAKVTAASKDLESVQDLFALEGLASYTHRFKSDSRLNLRLWAGGLEANDLALVPTNVRFFLGGDQSIRGYAHRSIGIEPIENYVNGGRYMVATSVEYERPFKPNWSYSYFVDAGDAFDDNFNLRVGAGMGVSWYSPVGPIRLSAAHGFDEPGDSFRIHIRVGAVL